MLHETGLRLALVHESPPRNVAGVLGLHVGEQLAPAGGVDAVGAHQQVARLLAPALEAGHRAASILLEDHQLTAWWYRSSG